MCTTDKDCDTYSITLRVHDEHFSKENKKIHSARYMYWNSFSQDSSPRSMGYGANFIMSYLTCWWQGIKMVYFYQYQVPIPLFTNQSTIRICPKMIILNNFEHNAMLHMKIAATLTLYTNDIFLIKMWQEYYIGRETWTFSHGKWVEISWLYVIII